jgi:hypothetical protein
MSQTKFSVGDLVEGKHLGRTIRGRLRNVCAVWGSIETCVNAALPVKLRDCRHVEE